MRPQREVATNNGQTYFVTSSTSEPRQLFNREDWADLFVETLYEYRPERFALHGFVVMPDHFHLLCTPTKSLELAVQCVKGGFSFRANKFLGWRHAVWVTGFSDHRIRDEEDFHVHELYIAKNAVELKIYARAQEHPYCSAGGRYPLDPFPRGLKPGSVSGLDGAAEAAPFQSVSFSTNGIFKDATKCDPKEEVQFCGGSAISGDTRLSDEIQTADARPISSDKARLAQDQRSSVLSAASRRTRVC